jgi:hypothetical protein
MLRMKELESSWYPRGKTYMPRRWQSYMVPPVAAADAWNYIQQAISPPWKDGGVYGLRGDSSQR